MIQITSAVISRWTAFWFCGMSPYPLSLLRIGVGVILLFKLTNISNLFYFSGISPAFPDHAFSSNSSFLLDGFHAPLISHFPVPSYDIFVSLEIAVFILAILFTIGLGTRIVGPLLALSYTYIFLSSAFLYHHHVFLFVLVLIILGFSHCGKRISADAFLFPQKNRTRVSGLAVRMIQVLVTIIYLFSFVSKLSPAWFSGEVVQIYLGTGRIGGAVAEFLVDVFPVWLLSNSAIFIEGLLTVGLWIPRVRLVVIFIGILFHIGIYATMPVSTYSFQMIVLYTAFLPFEWNRIRSLLSAITTAITARVGHLTNANNR